VHFCICAVSWVYIIYTQWNSMVFHSTEMVSKYFYFLSYKKPLTAEHFGLKQGITDVTLCFLHVIEMNILLGMKNDTYVSCKFGYQLCIFNNCFLATNRCKFWLNAVMLPLITFQVQYIFNIMQCVTRTHTREARMHTHVTPVCTCSTYTATRDTHRQIV
jgi:hypothetical protein